MFNLDNKLDQWRREFAHNSRLHRDELDELESHLLELFESLVRRGHNEPEAFSMATQHLGYPLALTREYENTRDPCTKSL